jgi:isoquinoline 1-oxidoreductase subunit beta
MNVSRRTFVKITAVAGAGLTLGISFKVLSGDDLPWTDAAFAPNAFLRIDEDGSITVMIGKSEMGQGVTTALPQLIAEELDVPFERVRFALAPAHAAYRDPAFGMQMTGGSTTIASGWLPMRQAGATARWLLREAAAQRWGVTASEIEMREGAAHFGGETLGYGALATEASALEPPEEVPLKDPTDFTIIGTPQARMDIPSKTTGEAVFGVDAGPADARVALVARCPVFGGTVRSYDASPALAIAGVDEVVQIESGVAVVADGYWAAKKGRDALVIEWDEGSGSSLDDAEISSRFARAVAAGGLPALEEGDVDSVLNSADSGETVSVAYALPYLAHATMEPMNTTALLEDGKLTIWSPTQFQEAPGLMGGGAKNAGAKAAGVSGADTEMYTTYLGGGFGRRTEVDFVLEAAELASKVDGAVKVMWSREDDIRHDYYRPASYHGITATLGVDGKPVAWKHDLAVQSIMARLIPGWIPGFVASWAGFLPGGVDPTAVEGASNQPYDVPNIRVSWADVPLPIPVGFWRSVGNSHNGFVVESFIDELSHTAGQDPFEYRRQLLGNHPRHKAVLEAVATAANWGGSLPEGRARGIAVVESFGSYVAEVAEVSVEDGTPRIHKVWCAVDCGVVVNPAIIRTQMESAIIYGLTAALHGEINIEGGRVVQGNFDTYPMLRMNEVPEVEVVLVPSGDAPGGVGEPGLPPIAPAVANALFALTGQRIRTLPIRLS